MINGWPDSQKFWRDRRIVVTGGAGFLGSFVVDELREHGALQGIDVEIEQGEPVRPALVGMVSVRVQHD